MEARKEKRIDQHLLVFFLSLGAPLVLYFNRHLDDNRLTSWSWVFGDVGGSYRLLIIISLSLLAAFVVTRIRLQWRPSYLFFISFVVSAFFWSTPEVIVDAARYFTQAKQLKILGMDHFFSELGHDIFVWTDLPLVPMIYGLIFKVFGENRIWLQVLNSLFFAGTVMLTYKLGEVLWHETLGRYAGFLLLGFPYLFTQSPLMLVDVPSMFFLLLAVYSFTCYLLQGGKMRFVTTSFSILLAIIAKYSLWAYLSVLVMVFAVFFITRRDRVIKRSILVLVAVLVAVGFMYLFAHEIINRQVGLLVSFQKSGLKRWGESFVSTFLFQTHPLLTATALLSAGAALVKRDAKYLIISFLVLVLVLLQVKRARYTIPVFPMLALMSSYGIMQLHFREIRKLLVACIVFTSIFVSLGGYLPFLHKMSAQNLQDAGKYLDEQKIASAWIVTLPQKEQIVDPRISLPLLDIYTGTNLLQFPDEKGENIDLQNVATSSLRFTWEFPLPSYYRANDVEYQAEGLVIIGSMVDQEMPHSVENLARKFTNKKIFSTLTGWFTYRTIVTVYF